MKKNALETNEPREICLANRKISGLCAGWENNQMHWEWTLDQVDVFDVLERRQACRPKGEKCISFMSNYSLTAWKSLRTTLLRFFLCYALLLPLPLLPSPPILAQTLLSFSLPFLIIVFLIVYISLNHNSFHLLLLNQYYFNCLCPYFIIFIWCLVQDLFWNACLFAYISFMHWFFCYPILLSLLKDIL